MLLNDLAQQINSKVAVHLIAGSLADIVFWTMSNDFALVKSCIL